jgi:hypothetical protein
MKRSPEYQEGPVFIPGETWYPRGQGFAREIVSCDNQIVRYRTKHGEFTTCERDFCFWIERLCASPIGGSDG